MSVIFDKIKHLFPGYFALVMATGALSIATYLLDYDKWSNYLFYLNTLFIITLAIVVTIRFLFFFSYVKEDLTSHLRGPGFFTIVAGINVYATELLFFVNKTNLALILWLISIILWTAIMYTFFTAITIQEDKPSLAEGINGAWLIAAVATQSISVVGTLLVSSIRDEQWAEFIFFVSLSMYLLGCMLYLSIITLIFYRFTFLHLKYSSYTPPYWINMGAVAITTLAGSLIILNSQQSLLIQQFIPFVKGFTLFFWVTGTWWIPLLVILMYWRYIIHKFPLNYDQQMWGMVFPVAMYTIATFKLSKALEIPFLANISTFFIYPAFLIWLLGIILMVIHLVRDILLKDK
ncbi:C4-dicarboxylate ABC transporter [Gracilibacillus dipsosauri]|uniref:C4-dicarboxylate ABC transporter n=1 Tax=Gracilibacillus dipsosauri TaxID=178340 RepID=A0A317L1W9_9BACI|nr:C4-dicarboxylate ABC transporter [Gracilibacillus dipsosauri]